MFAHALASRKKGRRRSRNKAILTCRNASEFTYLDPAAHQHRSEERCKGVRLARKHQRPHKSAHIHQSKHLGKEVFLKKTTLITAPSNILMILII